MNGNPGIEVELLPGARTPVPLSARLGDGQDSGEEKECTAISQLSRPVKDDDDERSGLRFAKWA